jgi:hypothetical protein
MGGNALSSWWLIEDPVHALSEAYIAW